MTLSGDDCDLTPSVLLVAQCDPPAGRSLPAVYSLLQEWTIPPGVCEGPPRSRKGESLPASGRGPTRDRQAMTVGEHRVPSGPITKIEKEGGGEKSSVREVHSRRLRTIGCSLHPRHRAAGGRGARKVHSRAAVPYTLGAPPGKVRDAAGLRAGQGLNAAAWVCGRDAETYRALDWRGHAALLRGLLEGPRWHRLPVTMSWASTLLHCINGAQRRNQAGPPLTGVAGRL